MQNTKILSFSKSTSIT